MSTGLLHLHNLLRWVILVLLVVAIVRHMMAMSKPRAYSPGDKKVNLFLMIAAHIQLLIGLYLWFVRPLGFKNIQNLGMGEVMKEPGFRFWAVEHNLGMLIAVVLITVGRGLVKKNLPDTTKHRRTFWYFLIALIIILVSVPWPFREAVARPWFPGM